MNRKSTCVYWALAAIAFLGGISSSGAAQTITHVPLYTFHGENQGEFYGLSVSSAGDVNGDGRADLIIAASGNNSGHGLVRVLSGMDGSVLRDYRGERGVSDSLGKSVSGAGDVNGDGTPDLIAGARSSNNGTTSGSAHVFSGRDGSVLFNFDGDGDFHRFGSSVSGAGDVNGDGRADLIVGGNGNSTNGANSGSARVLSGSDGSVLYSFEGESRGQQFGTSVSGVGDVNGDGVDDFAVAAERGGYTRVLSGSDGSDLYRFSGGDSVSGAGDVNGDGRADLIIGANNDDIFATLEDGFAIYYNGGRARVLSGSDGSVLHNFEGDSQGEHFGGSVSGAGDVNGDGTPDLIVGAPAEFNDGVWRGSARVLSGSDGSVLYNFVGDSALDSFGRSVSGAGDVNGDGIDDFIIGSLRGGANDSGYARVFVSQISPLLGDCNRDGVVDFLDIVPWMTIVSRGNYVAEADVNEDGIVDFRDIRPFVLILSS